MGRSGNDDPATGLISERTLDVETLSIQLRLAYLSLLNTTSVFEMFCIERSHSTIHNWVHKAELQPTDGRSPDHVAVDETVIQRNDKQYWRYAAVDPDQYCIQNLYRQETTLSFRELTKKYDINDAVVPVDGAISPQNTCKRFGFQFRYERHMIETIEHILCEVKRRT